MSVLCFQEIIVVYTDGDMEFWADSESSDAEDESTDEDVSQVTLCTFPNE